MSKRTLLLADDSVTIQKVVNLTFADEGIEVITVGDGDSAMEKISQISPDVVLADVHMPGLSGYQICEIVRQNPVTKDMPVILLVGSFEPFDESEAARVGANAYLTKPFQSIRQLVTQVTDLMDASGRTAEAEEPEDEEPIGQGPDTNDIDSLIQQSLSGPGTVEAEADTPAPRYLDAGMDDEMIETSSVDVEIDDETIETSSFDAGIDDEILETSSTDRLHEEVSFAEPEFFGVDDETSFRETESSSEFSVPDERTVEEASFDSFPDFREEASVAAAAGSQAPAEIDEFSRTEPMLGFGDKNPAPVSASTQGLDDLELLELPPMENGKTIEFTTEQLAEIGGVTRQVVSLSPELMDIIVQKVVDKLSEKY